MDEPHVCFDRILPDAKYATQPQRIALLKAKLWQPGALIRCRLSNTATPRQKAEVEEAIHELRKYVNLRIELVTRAPEEFRISFDPTQGAWSYIGMDVLGIPKNQATMNLGFNQAGTYLHEFGHGIGCIHEHQNPEGGINWNKEQVYRDLSGPPNNWSKETIDHNMFAAYNRNQLNGTTVDPQSIMMYAIPARWTTDGFSTQQNGVLSEIDKAFLRKVYPFKDDPEDPNPPPAARIPLPLYDLSPAGESIGSAGERDMFKFEVKTPGRVRVESLGNTPVVLRLLGPNDENMLIAATNNVGMILNASLDVHLNPGTYYVQVSHADPGGTGRYGVRALRFADNDPLQTLVSEKNVVIAAAGPIHPGRYSIIVGG